LNGELDVDLKRSSFRYGRLFETYLIQEIIRHNDYLERGFRFFYWRDKNGLEVDLIVARSVSRPVAAIEFKSKVDPDDYDLAGLIAFGEDYPEVPRYCFSLSPQKYDLPSGIHVVPWRDGLALIENLGKSKA